MSKRGSRSSGYTKEEDKFLCQVYIEVSQDPTTGYQTSTKFWDRVVETFENGKNPTWSTRSKKSIQCRFQTIERATRKLHACIKQCENRRPSGSSSDDSFNQAKEMLMEDPKFKSGWKFDHVWNIIKNFEKFKYGVIPATKASNSCGLAYASSESEYPISDSPTQASPSLSSFSLNLDEEDKTIGGSPSQEPIGIKRTKLKRKSDDQTSTLIKTLEEGNNQLLEQLKRINAQREHHLEIQRRNYALKEVKHEDKILFQDLKSIEDPNIRAYLQAQQTKILRKRLDQQAPYVSTSLE